MKIKIKRLPKAAVGGAMAPLNMPYAGVLTPNPFGLATSDTDNLEKNINDSVKPIDRDKANIEAEKGEVLFKFDAGGIFKIKGKKHSQGGTPLKADPQDFIFSDKKELALSKYDGEDFELKLGKSKLDNTPAKVLEREIDFKLYNKFMNIINDPNSDKFAIATAQIMLKKYQDKIGQVAFIQETKKHFPNGTPAFSEGTAPVYSQEMQDAKDKAPMFALGGPVSHYDFGGNDTDKCPCGRDTQGNCIPCSPDQLKTLSQKAKKGTVKDVSGMTKIGTTPDGDVYHSGTDASVKVIPSSGPKMTSNQWKIFTENYRKKNGKTWSQDHQNIPATDNLVLVPGEEPQIPLVDISLPEQEVKAGPLKMPNMPQVPQVPFPGFNIGMNGNEALSIAAPYLFAASTPTYYDMLVQKHTPDIHLDRMNNTQEVSDIKQNSSLGQREAFANMGSKTAALAASSMQASTNSAITRSNANLANTNRQIGNQESEINFQKDASDNDFNLGHIQETYRNNILSDQRTHEALTNGAAMSLNNMNAVQRNLDSINQGLTKSVLPYLTNAYYDKQGNYLGQGEIAEEWKDKVAYSKQMSPMTVNSNRMPIPTGYGSLNSVKGSGNENQYQAVMSSIAKDINSSDPAARAEARKAFILLNKPNNKNQSPIDEIMSTWYNGMMN